VESHPCAKDALCGGRYAVGADEIWANHEVNCRAPAGFMASLAVVLRFSRASSTPWQRQLRRASEGPLRLCEAVTTEGLLLYLRKVPRAIDQKSPSSVQVNQYRFSLQFYSPSVRLGRCASLLLWHTDSTDITSQYSQSLNEGVGNVLVAAENYTEVRERKVVIHTVPLESKPPRFISAFHKIRRPELNQVATFEALRYSHTLRLPSFGVPVVLLTRFSDCTDSAGIFMFSCSAMPFNN